jgi:hypothetical protein
MELNELYSAPGGNEFKIIGLELKDSDPWVSYINTKTEQEYSCRQEAFLSRFSPLPQPR